MKKETRLWEINLESINLDINVKISFLFCDHPEPNTISTVCF